MVGLAVLSVKLVHSALSQLVGELVHSALRIEEGHQGGDAASKDRKLFAMVVETGPDIIVPQKLLPRAKHLF